RPRHAAAGRRDRAALPRGRRPPHRPRLRRPLRGARPADRALRRRGDAFAGQPARRKVTMRLGMLLRYHGHDLALKEVLEAERLGYDSVWSGEAYGTDAVTPTAWILARTTRIKAGVGILPMPGRPPALTPHTALTLH